MWTKLQSSIRAHKTAIVGNGTHIAKVLLVLVVMAVTIAFVLLVRKIGFRGAIIEGFHMFWPYLVTVLGSILIWALFGYMPSYAAFVVRVIVCVSAAAYIANAAAEQKIELRSGGFYALCTIFLLLFVLKSALWLCRETETTQERRRIIEAAQAAHCDTVAVPHYERN